MGEVCAVRGLPGCFEPPDVAMYSVGLPYEREISQLRVASNQPVQAELQPSKTLERSWRCFNS